VPVTSVKQSREMYSLKVNPIGPVSNSKVGTGLKTTRDPVLEKERWVLGKEI